MSKEANKYPKSRARDGVDGQGPALVSWANEATQEKAFDTYASALEEASYSVANYRRDFSGVTSNTDGRPGLRNVDFDWFRPGQAAPIKPKDIMAYSRFVYRRIGIIHNAIDLMGDFACQGIRIVHPNPRIERFYNDWFNEVSGKFVSERLGHLLFREANVPVRMFTAKMNKSKRLDMQKSVGSAEIRVDKNDAKFQKAEIPWKYNFIDPLLVEPVGGPLATLTKNKLLTLKVPYHLKREIQRLLDSNNPEVQKVLEDISPDIIKAVSSNSDIILPPDKTYMYHYKKDDWQTWADPMTYSAFEPLNLYQRLQLADKAALDGAISKIRVWKIGSLEHKLAPTPTTSATLSDMLGANVGGGTIDIIWGPDIELIETSSDLHQFLGEEKYHSTLMAIYATLGIPPTLTGTFGASGTTNNFISLKTLTERLNYVRNIIIDFWTTQLKIVQKSMGFRMPAQVEFDYMYLDDPMAVSNLLMSMADRNIISDEFVQRNIKAKPNIENRRVINENKRRENADMEKVSPYHQVDQDHALKKIALQTGQSAPSEVGLELDNRKSGEKSLMDMKEQQMKVSRPPAGQKQPGSPGRPKNTRDTKPRKPKKFVPKNKAAVEMWAKTAQKKISDVINPQVIAAFQKSNLRSLTAEQFSQLEKLKFEILCNLDIGGELTEAALATASQNPTPNVHALFESWTTEALELLGKKSFSIDEVRDLRVSFYVDNISET
jgi:hypothetical protein